MMIFTKLPKSRSRIIPKYTSFSSYIQGQEPEPKIREYFYYIDHQGMLFLDDAKFKNFTSCFKEKAFLKFFFTQLRLNNTGRYPEFPYVSLCGRERNYIRCDDFPTVYTHFIEKFTNDEACIHLAHNHAGDVLSKRFQPEMVYMDPNTGRVYHPAPEKTGSIGLIRSKLAIELSKSFVFRDTEEKPPTQLIFRNKTYDLDKEWYRNLKKI